MKVAYIAGPYRSDTILGIRENIQSAEAVALEYWRKGYAVICPHKNTAFFDGQCEDDVWLEGDIELMLRCDLVVMAPGWEFSVGAIQEMRIAQRHDIPIEYYRPRTSWWRTIWEWMRI